FFQAEDGIRDRTVTGVQTCALPIYARQESPPHGTLMLSNSPPSHTMLDAPEPVRSLTVRRPRVALLRGRYLNPWEAQSFAPLLEIGRASCREGVWGAVCGGVGGRRR